MSREAREPIEFSPRDVVELKKMMGQLSPPHDEADFWAAIERNRFLMARRLALIEENMRLAKELERSRRNGRWLFVLLGLVCLGGFWAGVIRWWLG